MKIAYCLPDDLWIDALRGAPKDAAHVQQKYIADGLGARGHRITYLAPRGLEQVMFAAATDELAAAPQTWTSSAWFNLLSRLAWRLQKLFHIPYLNVFSNLRRENAYLQALRGFDVVIERNSLYNVGAARAAKKLRLPYVIFFDADQIAELDFMGKPLKGLLRWRAKNLLRENLSLARMIVCVSEPAKKRLITNWNAPADRIIVLANAVDVHRFKPDLDLRAPTRAALTLTEAPLVIFVGNFYQWHDIATLLDAFALALKSNPSARLVLVGDGSEREAMMRRAGELGISTAVSFPGYVAHAEVARYVNAADIAAAPAPLMDQEMWLSPMKLFEYMASGKAVIASATGQILNVICDGENGLLVPPGDAEALASALHRLINDAPLRAALGERARADAVKNHSWERYLTQLEQALEQATATFHS